MSKMTKTLYVLVSNGGDGSYYPHYTFNADFIAKLNEAEERGMLDYDSLGCDGDGFHYDTIEVPLECTYESMGISDCSYDVDLGDEEEEDEE